MWCERATTEPEVAEWGAAAIEWWSRRYAGTEQRGSLVVAQPRDATDLTRFAQRTERFQWLDSDAVAALEPALAGRFRRALFFADEAHLDPRRRRKTRPRNVIDQALADDERRSAFGIYRSRCWRRL